ncbi:hypothetical protein BDV33DRAFT_207343 [Aspergillus novoparasiticus]|uniref:Uncharacterized protein n=1 Tax=Aspergillus novoparasiticus TaxID=986946 RepID=A0A5N6EFV1_9EURO|nr:hypothetical protein BDV33DRAFT_207343 [Aspergillus novoparasiticus]
MAILQSTENEAANLKLVPSSQKHEWIRFTGPSEPSSYSISLCLMNLIHAIWLLFKCSGEYFSCACQNGVALIDTRNSARSLSQEKLDEDEDDLFPEQTIGYYHRMAIRKFGKLWEQNSGRESGRSLKLGMSECSDHIQKSLHEERTIEALEDWLVEDSKLQSRYLSSECSTQSLLEEAHSRPSSKAFVICLLKDYPTQTAKMLEFDNSALLDVIPIIVEQDCSEPIFARLKPTVLITTDSEKNSILHLMCEYGMEEWKSSEDLDRWNEKRVRLIKNLLTCCPSAIGLTNSSNQSAYQHRIRTFAACKKGVYKEERREIHLDLTELGHISRPVSDSAVKDLVRGIEFESITKYVRIPSFKVVVHPHRGNRYNDQEQQQLMRKGNVEDIFNILLEKGVKKIISLSVDDDEDSPHSDGVIESSEKFDIEEWDWRRKDLCSSVILKVARNARKVSLYSTGNKAVLRSWSAPDGLISLKKGNQPSFTDHCRDQY